MPLHRKFTRECRNGFGYTRSSASTISMTMRKMIASSSSSARLLDASSYNAA